MEQIYIVTGRRGTELFDPQLFYNKMEAEEFVNDRLADCIEDDFWDELEDEKISGRDYILEWAENYEYLVGTTYMGDGYDNWVEYEITAFDIDVKKSGAN